MCLSLGLVAMKRHYGQGKSYESKYLIGVGLQFQRFNPLSSLQEAWQPAGRYSAGGAEGSTYSSKGSQEQTDSQAARRRVSKPPNDSIPPSRPQVPQQGHTS